MEHAFALSQEAMRPCSGRRALLVHDSDDATTGMAVAMGMVAIGVATGTAIGADDAPAFASGSITTAPATMT
eukprot:5263826-Prymnesium_polylepis.1